MGQRKYYPELDRLRGIAILMVLLYHSIIIYPVNLTEQEFWGKLHTFLWTVEMPLFFLVSGVCFSYEGRYLSYIRKKSVRLLAPHFFFGLLDLLPRVIPNSLVNESYSAGQAWIEFLLYSSNEWFLWTLFLIFLVAPLLQKGLSQGLWGKIITITAVCGAYLIQNIVTPIFSLKNAANFMIYFVIGMLLQGYMREDALFAKKERKSEKVKQGVGKIWYKVMLLIAGILLFWSLSWQGWHGHAYAWVEVFGEKVMPLRDLLVVTICPGLTGVKMLWLAVTLLTVLVWSLNLYWFALGVGKSRAGAFFALCGRYSLPMYLLDGYALVVSRTLLVIVLGVRQPWVIVAGNFLLDIGIVLGISKYVLKRFRITCLLSGISIK